MPSAGVNSRRTWSAPAASTRPASALAASAVTAAPASATAATSAAGPAQSHTLTLRSSPPETSLAPSAVNVIARTGAVWPRRITGAAVPSRERTAITAAPPRLPAVASSLRPEWNALAVTVSSGPGAGVDGAGTAPGPRHTATPPCPSPETIRPPSPAATSAVTGAEAAEPRRSNRPSGTLHRLTVPSADPVASVVDSGPSTKQRLVAGPRSSRHAPSVVGAASPSRATIVTVSSPASARRRRSREAANRRRGSGSPTTFAGGAFGTRKSRSEASVPPTTSTGPASAAPAGPPPAGRSASVIARTAAPASADPRNTPSEARWQRSEPSGKPATTARPSGVHDSAVAGPPGASMTGPAAPAAASQRRIAPGEAVAKRLPSGLAASAVVAPAATSKARTSRGLRQIFASR